LTRYVIDTNLYIRATRDPSAHAALERFVLAFAPELYLHAVVAMELLTGATSADLELRTRANYLAPLEKRGRVITPTYEAWSRTGAALAGLLRAKRLSPGPGIRRSLVNDCLIAATAQDEDFVLITDNPNDFEMLAGVLPMKQALPWPKDV
jgi:predicted nucleic acid-binding protein